MSSATPYAVQRHALRMQGMHSVPRITKLNHTIPVNGRGERHRFLSELWR